MSLLAISLFSLSMSISPGPVNLIALQTGVHTGFRPALPYVSGATIGFTFLLIIVGFGFGKWGLQESSFLRLLTVLGAGFIAYMGFGILRQKPELRSVDTPPASFVNGLLLQMLNPKAWAACSAGVTAFRLQDAESLMTFAALYFVICFISIASWAWVGDKARSLLSSQRLLKIINVVLGITLILVAAYLLAGIY